MLDTPWREDVEKVIRPLTPDEWAGLEQDIRENGITVPVLLDEDNNVIDGINRTRIAAELGLTEIPILRHVGLSLDQKRRKAIELNFHRRHLSADEKGPAIEYFKGSEKLTHREVAKKVGVSPATVTRTLQKEGRNPREEAKAETRAAVAAVKEAKPEATTREIAEEVGVSAMTVSRVEREAEETSVTNVARETNVTASTSPPEPEVEEEIVGMPCYVCGKGINIHDMDDNGRPVRGRSDDVDKYWQFGQGWILQQGWPNASNHVKGIKWAQRFVHDGCLDQALSRDDYTGGKK